VTVFLVYLVSSKILSNKVLSIYSSLLFALLDSSHQATTWIATSINTHGASIFGFLSLFCFQVFLEKKRRSQTYYFFLSLFLLLSSLLFKEITIGLPFVFLLLLFLRRKVMDRKQIWKYAVFIMLFLCFYTCGRMLMIQSQRSFSEETLVTESQSSLDIFSNLFTFPAKIFSQSLVPIPQLLMSATSLSTILPDALTGIPGTTSFDLFTQRIMLQLINWAIFIGSCYVLFSYYKRYGRNAIFDTMLLGVFFVTINSVIYILSPGRGSDIPVVDSRNIYFPSFGAIIFLVAFFEYMSEKYKKFTMCLLALIVLLNTFWLSKEILALVAEGTQRKFIVETILSEYPKLPDKVLFYTESDRSYYGLPESEKIFPFQVNFGYILLTSYLPIENYAWEFVELGGYLYDIKAQGYKEINGKGFGYFRDINLLKAVIKSNNLPLESVISYSYAPTEGGLKNTTTEVRRKLSAF
jgi:hypothetical protein